MDNATSNAASGSVDMVDQDHLATLIKMVATAQGWYPDYVAAIKWAIETIGEHQEATAFRTRVAELSADGEERGGAALLLEYNKERKKVKALEAQVRELRAALELIANLQELNSAPIPRYEQARTIARKALGGGK